MFSPVESQVIFLSKETPIVNVGLRTAEVSYTNQNKTESKDRQHNGQKKKDKGTNNDLQNIAQKNKARTVPTVFFFLFSNY
jgi:hypothetical protein